jgi:hypothetical protein
LEFTPEFFEDYAARRFNAADRRAILRSLELLSENERHPSLRVHQLEGQSREVWSASASRSIRMTFLRLARGRKLLLTCTRHYTD